MTQVVHLRHVRCGRAAVLDLDRPLVVHAHSSQHLLLHLGGAPTRFGVNRDLMPLCGDSGVFVDTWQPHWYPHIGAATRSRILALYLDPDWLSRHGACMGFGAMHNALCVGAHAARLIGSFVSELPEHDDGRDGVLECLLLELLAALRPAAAGHQAALRPVLTTAVHLPEIDRPKLDRRIRKTLLFMRGHVGQRPDFAQIASEAGLSRPHFFELFQRDLGLTPNVYWNTLRMESALSQLADRSLSVAAVSANLGFSAQSNFTRFFRDIQGVAPAEYRAARVQTIS